MRRALLLAMLLVVPVACGSDGGDVGTGASTATTGSSPGGGGDRLELCSDVVPITTDVIGTLGATGNPDVVFTGVIATYGQEHADTYAGYWIDRDSGGTVIVAFTDDAAAHLDALAARRPLATDAAVVDPPPSIVDDRPIGEWDQAFDVVQVGYSERELGDAEERVSAALLQAGVGAAVNGTDIRRNRLRVDAGDRSEEMLGAVKVVVAELVPLDMVCIDGVLDSEMPPAIDPDAPLDVIVLPGPDGTYPPETEADCSGTRFELGALDPLVPVREAGIPDLAFALEGGLAALEGQHLPRDGWSLLAADDERATVIAVSELTMATIGFERTREGWSAGMSSLGEACVVAAALPEGFGEVEWSLDPAFDPPSATSTTVHVLVSGTACSSGQPLGERLLGPQIAATDDAVRIAFAAIPLSGAQTCQGNPPEPITVTLDEPLGDREVIDGRTIGRIDKLVAAGAGTRAGTETSDSPPPLPAGWIRETGYWTSYASDPSSGRELTVVGQCRLNGSERVDHLEVVESSGLITATLIVQIDPRGGEPCHSEPLPATAMLERPLGSRRVVQPTGSP